MAVIPVYTTEEERGRGYRKGFTALNGVLSGVYKIVRGNPHLGTDDDSVAAPLDEYAVFKAFVLENRDNASANLAYRYPLFGEGMEFAIHDFAISELPRKAGAKSTVQIMISPEAGIRLKTYFQMHSHHDPHAWKDKHPRRRNQDDTEELARFQERLQAEEKSPARPLRDIMRDAKYHVRKALDFMEGRILKSLQSGRDYEGGVPLRKEDFYFGHKVWVGGETADRLSTHLKSHTAAHVKFQKGRGPEEKDEGMGGVG